MKITLKSIKSQINNKILVSVILPTYNRGEKCINVIQDVLSQSHSNLELILINDGSNYENTKLIEDFIIKIKDFRIIYIKQENKGLASSLNEGLSRVRGDYITWVSDDNKITKDYIEMLLEPNADFSYSKYLIFTDQNRYEINNIHNGVKNLIVIFQGMASFLWKKKIIDKIGGFNKSLSGICEDYDFEIRTFLATENIAYIDKILVDYYDDISKRNYENIAKVNNLVKEFYSIYIDNLMIRKNIIVYSSNENNIDFFKKYDQTYAKINVCDTEKLYFGEDILFVPKKYKELVDNILIHSINEGKNIIKENNLIHSINEGKNIIKENNLYDISIVMTYFNRKKQIIRTLDGFEKNYFGKYKFEVIIVDDNSKEEEEEEEEKLDKIIQNYSFDIKLIKISSEEKGNRINPCTAYNKGFLEASGRIILIQNPECYHVGNILEYTLNNLKEEDYFSYSCFNTNSEELTIELLNSKNIFEKINDENFRKKNIQDNQWYNHPTEIGRNAGYHFCSAIYKSKLELIGGFDERFSEGSCFDDDEFLLSIKNILKLKILIIKPNNCFVIHQFHTRSVSFNIELENDENIIKKKWIKNKTLFEEIKANHEKYNFNYPKLLHLYWDGSPLSYLNYLTVLSFNEYHKDWRIIIYLPKNRNKEITWKTHEQKLKYEKRCYFNKLKEIRNVIIKYVSLDELGFNYNASEVIKSDYFRYYILQKHGGIWSDFDIIYTSSVENKMNFKEEIILFRCFRDYYYYPIGFFIAKPNNTFFKFLMTEAIKNYDPNEYQSIGAVMFNKLFPRIECIEEKGFSSIKICDHEYYLPWAWNQLEEFLEKKDNILPKNNIGIHWFNGATKSKEYAIELDARIDHEFQEKCYLDKFIWKYLTNKKISIVLAYCNKRKQLETTIKNINKTEYNKDNIEIILIDDFSKETEKLRNFITKIESDIKIKIIEITEKKHFNPCFVYNLGFKEAKGDIIVIQNAEVTYIGDCIKYIVQNIKENDWLTFNCYGLKDYEENNKLNHLKDDEIFNYISNKNIKIGGNGYYQDNVGGWLNHYSQHFVAYHYCGAIYKKDLDEKMSGGFFEEYKDGLCFDDDDFVNHLIYKNFNLKINKFEKDLPFVIHQYHEKSNNLSAEKIDELWKINQKIFFKRCEQINFTREVNINLREDKFKPKPTII